jgi:hypothetical protein
VQRKQQRDDASRRQRSLAYSGKGLERVRSINGSEAVSLMCISRIRGHPARAIVVHRESTCVVAPRTD